MSQRFGLGLDAFLLLRFARQTGSRAQPFHR